MQIMCGLQNFKIYSYSVRRALQLSFLILKLVEKFCAQLQFFSPDLFLEIESPSYILCIGDAIFVSTKLYSVWRNHVLFEFKIMMVRKWRSFYSCKKWSGKSMKLYSCLPLLASLFCHTELWQEIWMIPLPAKMWS
jgi:hypothetical protein